jgi:tetratricopeptide (TPR) repeat protein/two-component sensor histidine kinase
VQQLVFFLLCVLVATGCRPGPANGDVAAPEIDTVSYRGDLDTAKSAMRTGRYDAVERIARTVLAGTAGKGRLRKQRLHALSLMGQVHQRRSRIDSAEFYYDALLRLAEATRDTTWIGAAHINRGVVREIKGDYAGALAEGLEAMRWKELQGDSLSMARVLHNLSLVNWRRDSLDLAVDYLQRSLAIKRNHDPSALLTGLNGLGVLLNDAGRYDTAIVVLKESLALADSLADGAEREVPLSNIGLAFERSGRLDSAAVYYMEALADARAHDNSEVIIRTLYGWGDVLRAQGRYQEARPLLDSSLALAERIASLEDMKEAHASLVVLHERLNDPETALEHFRAFHELSDSLMNAGTQAAMAELELRYDTEHQQRENEELRTAQVLAELRADRNRWVAVGMGVGALALAVIAWATMQRNRQRARVREAELEQQALRLQMDPHFLFNALNTVPGLYASGDVTAANDHVGHLSRFLRSVLETSRRRSVPLSTEIELVEHYLRISANRKPGSFTWDVKIMPYVQPERVAVPPMLIQPLVENAIEHGFHGSVQGRVTVLVDRAGSVLHIEVKDNGVGRSAAAQRPSRRNGTSMGIDLVRKRLALFDKHTPLHEAVEVRDERDERGNPAGTTVILRMRVQHLNEHAAAGDSR